MAFDTAAARAAWNEAAESWDDFVEGGGDYYRTEVHGPALLAACGDVAGRRVLDLGCGQGWFTRGLAAGGAAVVGLDVADRAVAKAADRAGRHERYVVADAGRVGDLFRPGSFELATSCMAIHDMPDPAAALAGAARLAPRVVFSIVHPATDTPSRAWVRDEHGDKVALQIDRYFDGGRDDLRWDMPRLLHPFTTPRWQLPLGEWSALVAAAGLVIARLHEPRPTAAQVADRPELDDARRLPYFLIFDCVRAGPR